MSEFLWIAIGVAILATLFLPPFFAPLLLERAQKGVERQRTRRRDFHGRVTYVLENCRACRRSGRTFLAIVGGELVRVQACRRHADPRKHSRLVRRVTRRAA